MNIAFPFNNIYFVRNFTKSAAKGTQTSNQRCSAVETQIIDFVMYYLVILYYNLDYILN